MQPQTPASPTPEYDFILKDGQAPKKGLGLPMPNLPKPVLIGLGAFVVLIIIAVVASVLSSGGSSATLQYTAVLARAQEITRVSTNVGTLAQDEPTQDLAATVATVLTSEQSQFSGYLTSNKIKISTAALASDMDSATDTEMNTASTNGNLPSVFDAYLQTQLGLYQSALQAAYNSAGPNGKALLSGDFTSTQTLLKSPQIADAN